MRRVDNDHPRARGYGGADFIPVHREIRHRQLDGDRRCALQTHNRRVAVERGFKVDDLVARMDQPADGGVQPFAGAGGDQHFAGGIVAGAIQRGDFIGDTRFQRCQPGHRRVLVMARLHCPVYPRDERRIALKVRRTLGKVDGIVFSRELTDNGKNCGANVR